MTNKTPEELALEAYMAGLNEKKLKVSDNRLISSQLRGKQLAKDGTMKEAAEKRRQNPNWKPSLEKARKERSQNPNWIKSKTESSRRLAQDPTWLDNQKVGAEKRKARDDYEEKKQQAVIKRESNEQMKKDRAERNKKQATNPSYLLKVNKGVQRRDQDPEYHEALRIGRLEKQLRKGLIVCPSGIFLRQGEAAESEGIAQTTLQRRIKKDPTNYYYISHEEYIMLTGKEYTE
jgi:hypothetical protein